MKIRVFPSHKDMYNTIVIDTDDLRLIPSFGRVDDALPSVFVSDLISELINQN